MDYIAFSSWKLRCLLSKFTRNPMIGFHRFHNTGLIIIKKTYYEHLLCPIWKILFVLGQNFIFVKGEVSDLGTAATKTNIHNVLEN